MNYNKYNFQNGPIKFMQDHTDGLKMLIKDQVILVIKIMLKNANNSDIQFNLILKLFILIEEIYFFLNL